MTTIKLFALSTCIWCRKTEKHLEDLGYQYDVVYVDKLSGEEREAAMREVVKVNPSRSFPTLIVNGSRVVVGFKPDEIRSALQA